MARGCRVQSDCVILSEALLGVLPDDFQGSTATELFAYILTNCCNGSGALDGIQDLFVIDLQETGQPNQYTVTLQYEDEDGTSQTLVDQTPITLAPGLTLAQVQALIDQHLNSDPHGGGNSTHNMERLAGGTGNNTNLIGFDTDGDGLLDFFFCEGFNSLEVLDAENVPPDPNRQIVQRLVPNNNKDWLQLRVADHTSLCIEAESSTAQTSLVAGDPIPAEMVLVPLTLTNPSPSRRATAMWILQFGSTLISLGVEDGTFRTTNVDYEYEVIGGTNATGGWLPIRQAAADNFSAVNPRSTRFDGSVYVICDYLEPGESVRVEMRKVVRQAGNFTSIISDVSRITGHLVTR